METLSLQSFIRGLIRICLLKEVSDSQDKVYALLNLSIVLKIRSNH
jgi:hypothetical protein